MRPSVARRARADRWNVKEIVAFARIDYRNVRCTNSNRNDISLDDGIGEKGNPIPVLCFLIFDPLCLFDIRLILYD